MDVALRVCEVSKQYRIYDRPSDRLKETLSRGLVQRHRAFSALSDISFEVPAGTTTGIIGPNGCGKSTLLQIIAGTLEPTTGSILHHGRIAALLELGAGFNPEFTGIENVFMNAQLIGFSRRETAKLLPQIERFAEIGLFINEPVKTYSSGMYVRLAFAIAISADPNILIVDEALAVGDAVFQHRCLRRIKEMQERGVTVLFVSHDAAAVRALCSRALLLNAGRIVADGAPAEVLKRYQRLIMRREAAFDDNEAAEQSGAVTAGAAAAEAANVSVTDENFVPLRYTYRHGDGSAQVLTAELFDAATKRPVEIVETGAATLVRMRVRFTCDAVDPVCGFLIRDRHGIHAYGTNTTEQAVGFGTVRSGEVIETTFSFECWLGTDQYSISCAVHSADGISYDWLDGVWFFRVTSPILIEGIANLNASATMRRVGHASVAPSEHESEKETTNAACN